jgi:hypothetical protein
MGFKTCPLLTDKALAPMKNITPKLLSTGFNHFDSDGFLVSYPVLIRAFEKQSHIDADFLLFAAHAAYGWMPKKLNWKSKQWKSEALLIEAIRVGQPLTASDMKKIVALINRSISGASKLLHFIAPNRFPILDSHIYTYLNNLHYREQPMDCEFYIKYSEAITKVTKMPGFSSIQQKVNQRLNYGVTSIRAAELLLFNISVANKKPTR